MGRKLTRKQVRYLWAVGFFKTSRNPLNMPESHEDLGARKRTEREKFRKWVYDSGKPYFREGGKNLPQHYQDSLTEYVAGDFHSINRAFRSGNPSQHPDSKNLRDAFQDIGVSLQRSDTLYRGVHGEFSRQLHQQFDRGSLVGSEMTDLAPVSTSGVSVIAYQFATYQNNTHPVVFRIRPNPKKKAILTAGAEGEVILEPGQSFKILSGHREKNLLVLDVDA